MLRKGLSVLLVLVMVLTAIPLTNLTSFAEESEDIVYLIENETYDLWSLKYSFGEDWLMEDDYILDSSLRFIPNETGAYTIVLTGYIQSLTVYDLTEGLNETVYSAEDFYNSSDDKHIFNAKVMLLKEHTYEIIPSPFNVYKPTPCTVTVNQGNYNELEWEIHSTATNDGIIIDRYKGSDETLLIPTEVDGVKVVRINNNAFKACSTLTSIVLSKNIDDIWDSAFVLCSSLKSITIPVSVTSISACVFYGCDSLTDIYYQGTKEQWSTIDIDGNNKELYRATIHCTDGDLKDLNLINLTEGETLDLSSCRKSTGEYNPYEGYVSWWDVWFLGDFIHFTPNETCVYTITLTGDIDSLRIYDITNNSNEEILNQPIQIHMDSEYIYKLTVELKKDHIYDFEFGYIGFYEPPCTINIKQGIDIENGWVTDNGNTYYYENGEKITGRMYDINVYYPDTESYEYHTFYFDNDGVMLTGWGEIQLDDGTTGKIYAAENGEIIGFPGYGLVSIDGDLYYFGSDGIEKNNSVGFSPNEYYYFGDDGKAEKNTWIDCGYVGTEDAPIAERYYAGEDGKLLIGWHVIDGKNYYFNPSWANNEIIDIDGVEYTFDKNGNVVGKTSLKNGLLKENGKYYYYVNGVKQTGWQNIKRGDGKVYKHYFDENGVMATGWKSIKNSKGVAYKYYFGTNGCMVTGWQKIANSKGVKYTYYFHTNGVMLTGWQKIKNSKGIAYQYYFNPSNGVMLTGWQKIKNAKGVAYQYYFNPSNGVMLTGWQKIKNSKGVAYQYYFHTNGVMLTGWQNIKNSKGVAYKYYFGANGVMRTGWQWIANAKGVKYRYYFGTNGYMRTGWQNIKASNGKTYKYYFYNNGVNAINRNVKIGNKTYKFNKYGICTNA